MIVYSSEKPSAYFYHVQPRNPEKTLVRFCKNPRQETTEAFGQSTTQWVYDEYTVEIDTQPNMDEYIKNHLNELRAEAKGGASAVTQLMAQMEAYNTANQLAIAELAEAMLGGAGNG